MHTVAAARPPRGETCVRACLFVTGNAAWIVAFVMVLGGRLGWATACAAFALAAALAGRWWSRASPIPFPYWGRSLLFLPRWPHTSRRLTEMLAPSSSERLLEIGPGVGVHALPVAAALLPDGVLDVLDVQQEMLDDLMRRATSRGLTNIVPRLGDAQALPYPDHVFDAAYLVSVLGEIPDGMAALRELCRVLKPGGRLLVAEHAIDPDFIKMRALRAMAGDAGLVVEEAAGPFLWYTAVLRPARQEPSWT